MSNSTIQPSAVAASFAGLAAVLPIVPPTATLTLTGAAPSASSSLAGPCRQSVALPGGTYAAYNIVGPLIVKPSAGIVAKVFCSSSGTLKLNDCTTQAAAVAGNLVATCVLTGGQVLSLDWPCATGIVASSVSGVFSVSFT